MTPPFVPGLELSRRLWAAVAPLLTEHFPGLTWSAARLGTGSEVLGLDTERSADHEWGPRLQLFLREDDGGAVPAMLAEHLPKQIAGWPTHFEPVDAAIGRMAPTDGPVRHRVEVTTVARWCDGVLGFDPRQGPTTFDWLATPGQRLAEVTGGAVFADGLGELHAIRARLAWYPDQLWWHLMAAQWERLAEEEAFPGRCAEVGDETGCRVEVARPARDVMRLCLLVDRRHPPYGKWLGTAFARSPSGATVGPPLRAALGAGPWPEREDALAEAYRRLAAAHNALGVTAPLDGSTRHFHDRPFQVLDAGRFAAALRALVTDPEVAALPPVGGIDSFVDSTAVLTDPRRARAVLRGVLAG